MLPQVERPGTLEKVITALQAVLKFLAPFETQEDWKRLTYYSDWMDYAPLPQKGVFRKDPLGTVWVRAEVSGVGPHPSGDCIAVLPVGYRPPVNIRLIVADDTNYGSIEVTSSGRINHLIGATGQVSLHFSFTTRV